MKSTGEFDATAIRGDGMLQDVAGIVLWDGAQAAVSHLATAPKLCVWAIVAMFACFEEFIFALYRILLTYHPEPLLKWQEEDPKLLRRLRRAAESDSSQRAGAGMGRTLK